MPITIYECLQNANHNLRDEDAFANTIGKRQLNNAVVLLEKGYSLDDEVEPLLKKHGKVENVPEKESDVEF